MDNLPGLAVIIPHNGSHQMLVATKNKDNRSMKWGRKKHDAQSPRRRDCKTDLNGCRLKLNKRKTDLNGCMGDSDTCKPLISGLTA